MIDRIIEFSLKNRFIILMLYALLAGWGYWALVHTPIDAIPDLSENQVIVFTDWPGRSPQEVEDQVTYPLTVNLQGLAGVHVIRSSSAFGFSMINIIFNDDTDLYFARTRVLEKLNLAASQMPPGVVPTLGPDATGVGQVYWYTVEGKGQDMGTLRSLQDWFIRYQLNSVPGVAEVASVGGYVRQYQVDIDPNKLRAYGVTLADVRMAIERSNNNVGGKLIEGGGKVVQETRLFNPDTGTTRSMRSKEDAHDYRYFPDPDLLPLELEESFVEECRASLPELPDAKRARYVDALGISAYNAAVLTAEVETARWFEALLDEGAEAKQASNWVMSELFGALNRLGKSIEESPVSPAQAAELLKLVADGTLSGSLAKQVFEKMLETGDSAGTIVEREGLKQTSDTGAIEAVIADVLAKNPGQLEQYRGGKEALFGFFVGQTMKAMGGKANPQVVNELLKKALA